MLFFFTFMRDQLSVGMLCFWYDWTTCASMLSLICFLLQVLSA